MKKEPNKTPKPTPGHGQYSASGPHAWKYTEIARMLTETDALIEGSEPSDDDDSTHAAIDALLELDRKFDFIHEAIQDIPSGSEKEVEVWSDFSTRLDALIARTKEKLEDLGYEAPEEA